MPDVQLARTFVIGLMESTRPGSLGGLLLMVTCLLSAVGVLRAGRAQAERGGALRDAPPR
ncbi:hypothetical protein [Sorangium cellulosum]|uniref:hypothetical protein n=1 Tax=Sorangium cellulosum TaxID=56 RepID=UPI000CF48845|nr:hypothetical protein [Sorangium cellulosum]